MANIVKAIEIEKEYVAEKIKGKAPFALIDEIKKCGFRSFEEYFDTKKKYQFRELEFAFRYISQEEVESELLTVFDKGTVGIWFCDHPKTCVFGGHQGLGNFNEEYCVENDIVIYPYLSNGGIIVHQDGDFTYAVSCPVSLQIDHAFFLERTRYILQKYTNKKVTVDGNDILVDGQKVCGSTVYNKNGLFLFMAYFSFSDKTELIKSICNKKIDKEPSYIDFMTRDVLKQEVAKWLKVTAI